MSSTKAQDNEDDDDAWACFNPFFQDCLKHTEILERLVADADTFDLDELKKHDEVALDIQKETEICSEQVNVEVQETNLSSEQVYGVKTNKPHQKSPRGVKTDPVIVSPWFDDCPAQQTPWNLGVESEYQENKSFDIANRNSTVLPLSSLDTPRKSSLNISNIQNVISDSQHSRSSLNNSNFVVSVTSEPSVLLELETSGHLYMNELGETREVKQFNQAVLRKFSKLPTILNVLQACSRPFQEPIEKMSHNCLSISRFLVQANNEQDRDGTFTSSKISLWKVAFDNPNFQDALYLWEMKLPCHQYVTHMAFVEYIHKSNNVLLCMQPLGSDKSPCIANTTPQRGETKIKQNGCPSDEITIALSVDMDNTVLDFSEQRSNDLNVSAQFNHKDESQNYHAASCDSVGIHGTDLNQKNPFDWCLAVVTVSVEPTTPIHEVPLNAQSSLFVLSALTGAVYLHNIPLEGGVVTHLVTSQNDINSDSPVKPFSSSSCSTLLSQTPKASEKFYFESFGLLTCSGKLHILDLTLNFSDQKDPYHLESSLITPRFQRQILDLSPLQCEQNTVPVAVTLFKSSCQRIRVWILFTNGVAYCYDEFHIIHRLDELNFIHSDYCGFVYGLPFHEREVSLFGHQTSSYPCFRSLSALQQESWKLYHAQSNQIAEPNTDSLSLNLGNVLLDCLKTTQIMNALESKAKDSQVDSNPLPLFLLTSTSQSSHTLQDSLLDSVSLHFQRSVLNSMSLDHLFHQVRASALLASASDFACWLPLLCIRALECEAVVLLRHILDICLNNIYEQAKRIRLFHSSSTGACDSCHHILKHRICKNWKTKQQSENSFGSRESQKKNLDMSSGDPPCLFFLEPNDLCDNSSSVLTKLFNPQCLNNSGLNFLWWLQPHVLHDMQFTAEYVFFDLVIKTILPQEVWYHFDSEFFQKHPSLISPTFKYSNAESMSQMMRQKKHALLSPRIDLTNILNSLKPLAESKQSPSQSSIPPYVQVLLDSLGNLQEKIAHFTKQTS